MAILRYKRGNGRLEPRVALKRFAANLFPAYVFQRHGMHVRASLTPCPGGAFIAIEYGGISEKMEIERVLDAAGAKKEGRENVLWEFFGVPYGWMNT